jgi:hypothetical protein
VCSRGGRRAEEKGSAHNGRGGRQARPAGAEARGTGEPFPSLLPRAGRAPPPPPARTLFSAPPALFPAFDLPGGAFDAMATTRRSMVTPYSAVAWRTRRPAPACAWTTRRRLKNYDACHNFHLSAWQNSRFNETEDSGRSCETHCHLFCHFFPHFEKFAQT